MVESTYPEFNPWLTDFSFVTLGLVKESRGGSLESTFSKLKLSFGRAQYISFTPIELNKTRLGGEHDGSWT